MTNDKANVEAKKIYNFEVENAYREDTVGRRQSILPNPHGGRPKLPHDNIKVPPSPIKSYSLGDLSADELVEKALGSEPLREILTSRVLAVEEVFRKEVRGTVEKMVNQVVEEEKSKVAKRIKDVLKNVSDVYIQLSSLLKDLGVETPLATVDTVEGEPVKTIDPPKKTKLKELLIQLSVEYKGEPFETTGAYLSRELGLSTPYTNKLLRDLEEDGFIDKETVPRKGHLIQVLGGKGEDEE